MYRPFKENVEYVNALIHEAENDPTVADELQSIITLYVDSITDGGMDKETALDEAIEAQFDRSF